MAINVRPPNDIITQSFTDGFNKAQAFYADDRLEECIEEARSLIAEPAIPRYHRIRTLLLLTDAVEDPEEAWDFLREAKVLWRLVRRTHPEGQDNTVDTLMKQMWDTVVHLKDVLEAELGEFDMEDGVDAELAAHDAAEQEAMEWATAEEEADAATLGITVEEARLKTASKAAVKDQTDPAAPKAPAWQLPVLSKATVSTYTANATSEASSSFQSQAMLAASRAAGFGGDKPYRSARLEPTSTLSSAADTDKPVDASEFLIEGGAEPLLGRARSQRRKQAYSHKQAPKQRLLPEEARRGSAEASAQHERPPSVPPQYLVELFHKPEDSEE